MTEIIELPDGAVEISATTINADRWRLMVKPLSGKPWTMKQWRRLTQIVKRQMEEAGSKVCSVTLVYED